MANMPAKMHVNKGRKLLLQLAFGGAVGFLAGYFSLSFLDKTTVMGIDQQIVIGIGMMYLFMGLIGGFALMVPALGSKILNVEDAEEIRDQRRVLTGSSICMIPLGALLIVLPMAGPGGAVSPFVAIAALLAVLVLLIVVSIRDWPYYDEMLRAISIEAGNVAFMGIGGVLLVWASAAWVKLVAAPTPLSLVAVISGGYLIAIIAVSAQKGLLKPR